MADDRGLSTRAVHAGAPRAEPGGSVVTPIAQTTTFFSQARPGGEVRYTRYGNNPNHEAVAEKIAALEETEAALVVGSGMAAVALTLLSFAGNGDHIIAGRELYGGTLDLLKNELPRYGIETTFTAGSRTWRASLTPQSRLLYTETLSNPLLNVADLEALGALARERGIPLVVDATFTPPVMFQPARHGADVVLHSATKYLGGHTDVTAGVVAGPKAIVEEVRHRMKRFGSVLDPHATWLLERGLKTLAVRVERQSATALELAQRLREHPAVAKVHYPGLTEHPDHERAAALFDGFGGMLSLVLAGGDDAALRALQRLQLFRDAPSLGGVESLASMPRHTSHAALSREERHELGIDDGFLRLSVGLEDVDDLWVDLASALIQEET
jgi:cystathionine beta-lyase/cystathionine gamma-synthase